MSLLPKGRPKWLGTARPLLTYLNLPVRNTGTLDERFRCWAMVSSDEKGDREPTSGGEGVSVTSPSVIIHKRQRVRDPVHGLIIFDESDETDRLAWLLINSREFQRLRRIRQLGFSDLVYPGATHSRLGHSIGVYHVAGRLLEIIRRKSGKQDNDRERVVRLAALLHDVGHGPFSHVFEPAAKAAGVGRKHEEWSAEIVSGNTEVARILDNFDSSLPSKVAALLKAEEAPDHYGTVVSSQFDADRLDYLQRDRLMTGVQSNRVDQEWLLDCLEVGTFYTGDSSDPVPTPCLYLNHKGIRTAEEYLELRFRLYMMVYMHKTTRGAEKIFGALLTRLAEIVRTQAQDSNSVLKQSRLAKFFTNPRSQLAEYLSLDDSVAWAEMSLFQDAVDPILRDLAERLCSRRLYKCFDVAARLDRATAEVQQPKFIYRVRTEFSDFPGHDGPHYFLDDAKVTPYKWYDFEDRVAFQKVLVQRDPTQQDPVDIGYSSAIIQALRGDEGNLPAVCTE